MPGQEKETLPRVLHTVSISCVMWPRAVSCGAAIGVDSAGTLLAGVQLTPVGHIYILFVHCSVTV